ncbi:MAG: family N-acetyltransferase [Rhodoglobus sp.]|nr:family N-acetyltransferase [Rhodoglobus sp.]
MSAFTIDELTIPTTLDEPAAADFIRAIEVGNEVEAIGYGTPDLAYEPDEELAIFLNPHEPKRMLVARVDGEIVARALFETTIGDDADTAWLATEVLPEFRGRGIGTALANAVEQISRDEGKTKAVVYAPIAEGPGERLPSPTGFGSIVADREEVRFLQARGYRLEQIERLSRLALPVADVDALVAAAQERSGPDYRLQFWVGRTPERWQADIAELGTRMSTDAPTAGLEEPEDVWTVERVIEADDRAERMSPRVRHAAAVEHIPTGRLVGYTILSVPRQVHRAVDQYATIVMREHRGHKLGMLLKVGNLAHLARVRPGHPSVMTFNAEENRHMLDVNEAVGFVPVANESAWRKDLL